MARPRASFLWLASTCRAAAADESEYETPDGRPADDRSADGGDAGDAGGGNGGGDGDGGEGGGGEGRWRWQWRRAALAWLSCSGRGTRCCWPQRPLLPRSRPLPLPLPLLLLVLPPVLLLPLLLHAHARHVAKSARRW